MPDLTYPFNSPKGFTKLQVKQVLDPGFSDETPYSERVEITHFSGAVHVLTSIEYDDAKEEIYKGWEEALIKAGLTEGLFYGVWQDDAEWLDGVCIAVGGYWEWRSLFTKIQT